MPVARRSRNAPHRGLTLLLLVVANAQPACRGGLFESEEAGAGAALTTELSRDEWTVTASPTAGDERNMLDGNLGTRWTTGRPMANGQLIQIDLGSARTFDRIDMDSAGSTGDYARGYAIYVSSDGSNWGSAIATGAGTDQLVSVDVGNQAKRYVRIVQTGTSGSWWSIHELRIYASNQSRALDRSRWITSASLASDEPASRAIDGSDATRWSTGVPMAAGQWFSVDTGASATIDGLRIDTGGSPGDYPRGYEVYLSSDGTSWGSAVATGIGSSVTTISFAPRSARYLRIVQTGSSGSWWSIHELLAFGSGGSSPPPPPPQPPPPPTASRIKLVSCNTSNANDPSGHASILGPLDADVIFLQEVSSSSAASFKDALNAYEVSARSGKVWASSSSDTAILTWRPIGDQEVKDIGQNSWPNTSDFTDNPHRVGARATIAFDGVPVTFLATHLDWNPDRNMTNHIANRTRFLAWADGIAAGGGRFFVGGDLNAWTAGGDDWEGNEQRLTVAAFNSRWTDHCIELYGLDYCNDTETNSNNWTPDHLYHSAGLRNLGYALVDNPCSDHKILVVQAEVQ